MTKYLLILLVFSCSNASELSKRFDLIDNYCRRGYLEAIMKSYDNLSDSQLHRAKVDAMAYCLTQAIQGVKK